MVQREQHGKSCRPRNRVALHLTNNQLFIDQPTTVGLSYSIPVPAYQDSDGNIIQLPNETCPDYAEEVGTCGTYSKSDISLVPNTTQGAAPNMWKTLQGFMGAFPNYSRNGFSFTTESYGGHYGPVFNGTRETRLSIISLL